MKAFAALYTELDETTATNAKIAALVRYFRAAEPGDAAWAVHFLRGHRPKRLIRSGDLRTWAAEEAGIPDWLFEESYHAVGDLAETIGLLLPEGASLVDHSLSYWVEERLLPLRTLDESDPRAGNEVLDRLGDEDFACLGHGRHTRSRADRDTGRLASGERALAGVDADAHTEIELS